MERRGRKSGLADFPAVKTTPIRGGETDNFNFIIMGKMTKLKLTMMQFTGII